MKAWRAIRIDHEGVHEACELGFDWEIDKKNRLIILHTYENFDINRGLTRQVLLEELEKELKKHGINPDEVDWNEVI